MRLRRFRGAPERDLPLVPEVVGQKDRRHAALAELTLDGVAAFEGGVEAGDGIGHWPTTSQPQLPQTAQCGQAGSSA